MQIGKGSGTGDGTQDAHHIVRTKSVVAVASRWCIVREFKLEL